MGLSRLSWSPQWQSSQNIEVVKVGISCLVDCWVHMPQNIVMPLRMTQDMEHVQGLYAVRILASLHGSIFRRFLSSACLVAGLPLLFSL